MKQVQWNLESDKAWIAYSDRLPTYPRSIYLEIKRAFKVGYDEGQNSLMIREEK